MKTLLVAIGAAFGAPTRHYIDMKFRSKYRFPLGIMLINITGSFLIGLVANSSQDKFAFWAIGFAGAFTTWSTFALDIYLGIRMRDNLNTVLNFLLSLVLGFAALKLGMSL